MVTNIFQMPVSHLSKDAQTIIKRLNSKRLFSTEEGLPRDWRGLATLVGLTTQDAENRCAMKVLEIWVQSNKNSKVHHLFHHLQTIDRYDLHDDLMELAAEDRLIEKTEKWTTEPARPQNTDSVLTLLTTDELIEGRPLSYDGAVVHADAEPDNEFANALIEIMTKIGFRMFTKSDLRSDVMPLTAMSELIQTRCRYAIFILSPAFSRSPEEKFLSQYVHAKKVGEQSHQMILCELETCERLKELMYYKPLDHKKNTKFWPILAWNLNDSRTPRLYIPPWVRSVRYTSANGHTSVTASAYTVNGSMADEADTLVANTQTDGGHRQRSVTNVANDRRHPPPNSNVAHLTPYGFVGHTRYASGCNGPVCNGLFADHPVAGGFSEHEFVADKSIAVANESVAINKCLANESVAEESAADASVANTSIADESVAIKCLADESVAEEFVVDDSIADNGQDVACNKVTDGHLQEPTNQYIVNIQVVSEHIDTHSNGPPGQLSDLQSQRPDAPPAIKHAILEDVAQWCRKRLNILRNKLYPKRLRALVTK